MSPPRSAPARRRAELPFAVFRNNRPAVIVASHERSGSHFLMNSIARGFGYTVTPRIDFDYSMIQINFFSRPSITQALEELANFRLASIIKSHHCADFFDGILDEILRSYVIFYIHRDPVDVMLSFWRYVHHWPWHEGPKCADPLVFAAAEPEGHLMRYQTHQRRSMLDRWAKHVEGWCRASQGRTRLRLVSYAALKDNYAATLTSFSELLGRKPKNLTPPRKDRNVICGAVLDHTPDVAALRARTKIEVGETMRLLGYL
jgi:hypothetical protein